MCFFFLEFFFFSLIFFPNFFSLSNWGTKQREKFLFQIDCNSSQTTHVFCIFENTLPGFIKPRQKTIRPPSLEPIPTKPTPPKKKKPQATVTFDGAEESPKPRKYASTQRSSLEVEKLSLMTPETQYGSDSSSSSQSPIIIRRKRSTTESLTYTSQE